jgi:hypothetical protein
LLAALVLAGLWWVLAPRIETATEDEVRARIAPELLEPLPRPPGGAERYAALLNAAAGMVDAKADSAADARMVDVQDPRVAEIIELLRQGPLDRIDARPGRLASLPDLANGLTRQARMDADAGRWSRADDQMAAAFLLLDRLADSDAGFLECTATLRVEEIVYRTTFHLAVREDLPDTSARKLTEWLVADRHEPADVMRVLRGEMQRFLVSAIARSQAGNSGEPLIWAPSGSYDPLDTAALFSEIFLEAARNSNLPVSSWSHGVADRLGLSGPRSPISGAFWRVPRMWESSRIRMALTHNSIGHELLSSYAMPPVGSILRLRTMQDQIAAVLAIRRFRNDAGRDPRDFEELLAAGLLQAVPMDHRRGKPLTFNVQAVSSMPRTWLF